MLKLEDALGCFHRWRGHLDKLWEGEEEQGPQGQDSRAQDASKTRPQSGG